MPLLFFLSCYDKGEKKKISKQMPPKADRPETYNDSSMEVHYEPEKLDQ